MTSLQNYTMPTTSLQDFMPDAPVGSIANDKTKTNIASNVALLSKDPVATFNDVQFELDAGTGSATRAAVLTRLQQQGVKANQDMFMEFMARPDITDEERRLLAAQLASETVNGTQSEEDIISEQSLTQPDGVYTEEGFLTREDQLAIYKEANDYDRIVQSLINSNSTFKDKSTLRKAAEIGEVLVPFVEQSLISGLRKEFQKEGLDVGGNTVGAFLLMGSSKMALAEAFQKMPLSARLEMLGRIEEYVKSNDSVVLDSNGLFLVDQLQTILVDGSYSTGMKWIDNTIGVLDVLGLVGAARGVLKAGRAKKSPDDGVILEDADDVVFPDEKGVPTTTRRGDGPTVDAEPVRGPDIDGGDIKVRSVQTEVVPTSPSRNLARNNTGKARQLHEATVADETEGVARAVSGAPRDNAIVDALAPQLRKANGGVEVKLATPNYINDIELMSASPKIVRNSDTPRGKIYYYNSEKVAERSIVVNDFQSAVGLNSRPNTLNMAIRTDGLDLGVTYGPLNHGYNNANDAVDLVKYHLRDYGILENNITVLKREASGYKPVKLTDNMPTGDYLVQVDYKHRFSAKRGQVSGKRGDSMVNQRPPEEDRIGIAMEAFRIGGLKDYIFSPEITLDRTLMNGAFVAVDQAVSINKQLTDIFNNFLKPFKKLPKARKDNFTKAVYEANTQGLAYTRAWAVGKWGMAGDEYDLLMKFKTAQDQLFWLENSDYITSLKNNNYGVFEDGASRLIARPIGRTQAPSGIKALDPTTGILKEYTNAELTALYANNNTLAQLRTPFTQNGEVIKYIYSSESLGEGYLRSINEGELVLNYRPGYFKINYTDPIFIVEELADGTRKTVATAPGVQAADMTVRRMNGLNNGSTYFHRVDLKQLNTTSSEANFDMASAQGRSPQRYRGKKLEDSTVLSQPLDDHNIMDPVQAFQAAASSISRRTSTRDYLDAYKTRLVSQYPKAMPTDEFGRPRYPVSVDEIKDKTGRVTKDVGQAKSLYRYVNALEDSANSSAIADRTKAALHAVADKVGKASPAAERKFRVAGDINYAQFAAGRAFELQVATNPLAQAITQTSGVLISAAYRPTFGYAANGLYTQMWSTWSNMLGIRVSDNSLKWMNLSRKEWDVMMEQFERSGLFYAADINNLVRSGTREMVRQNKGVVISTYQATVDKVREMGFDQGERANLMAGYLTKADEARKAGKLNNSEDWERVAAEARSLTFGMNEASQFAYQRNELRVPLQYMQVVHKGLLLPLTKQNRRRAAALGPMILLTYGAGGIPGIEYAVDKATEDLDPEVRSLLMDGLLQYGVNSALSLMTQTEVELAIKERTSPFNYNDAQETVRDLFSGSFIDLLTESPSAQVGGKVLQAMADGLEFFNVTDDKLPEDPMEFDAFVKSVASTTSMFTNSFKAYMAVEYGKAFSANGYIVDQSVNKTEAWAKLFGFRTVDEARQWALNVDLRGESTKENPAWSSEGDVREWYSGVKRQIFLSGDDPTSAKAHQRIYGSIGHNLFSKNPSNITILQKLMDRDALQGDYKFVDGVAKAIGAGIDQHEAKNLINRLPNLSREHRKDLLEIIDRVEALKEGKE